MTYETEESADLACEEPFHTINDKKVREQRAVFLWVPRKSHNLFLHIFFYKVWNDPQIA